MQICWMILSRCYYSAFQRARRETKKPSCFAIEFLIRDLPTNQENRLNKQENLKVTTDLLERRAGNSTETGLTLYLGVPSPSLGTGCVVFRLFSLQKKTPLCLLCAQSISRLVKPANDA